MTQTSPDIELAPAAAARLDEYLRNVRASLVWAPDVSPDEIEADIREHVDNELRAAPRPVSVFALEAVLTRLGLPSQWGAADDPSLWQRAGHMLRERLRGARAIIGRQFSVAGSALRQGPEDWRLAYLSFGVFALGVVTILLFPLCLAVSYILSRAGIAVMRERGIELGAGRKWLLYPPLVLVSGSLLTALVLGPPLGATAAIIDQVERADRQERWEKAGQPSRLPPSSRLLRERYPEVVTNQDRTLGPFPGNRATREALAALLLGMGMYGAWWLVVGLLAVIFPATARAVFAPLCDGLRRKHGWQFAGIGAALLLAWVVVAFEIGARAGFIR